MGGNGGGPIRAVESIEKWVKASLYQSDPERRFCRLIACQLINNKRGEDVFYIDVPEKKAGDQWAEETALDVWGRVAADAAGLPGLQRYAVYSYFSDDPDHHTSRTIITVEGGGESDDSNPLASEGPDKLGLTSQAMRHTEALAKINVSGQMTMIQGYQTLVGKLSGMVEKLLDQRQAGIDREYENVTRQQQHEIELTQAQARAKAIEKLGDKLGLFLPALANKIAGQQLFPVQANAMMMMLKGFVTSIASDEHKMKTIMGVLDPEQQVVFFQMMEEMTKTDDKGLTKNGANGATSESSGGAETPDEITPSA
jgi:hypothetical protein